MQAKHVALLLVLAALAYAGLQPTESVLILRKPRRRSTAPRATAPRATRARPPASTDPRVWTDDVMRSFVVAMSTTGVPPLEVLRAVAAGSDFDPTTTSGEHKGLLLLRQSFLDAVGYTGEPFETLTPLQQFPWMAAVISYRIAQKGSTPQTVHELAEMLAPYDNPMIQEYLRSEVERRVRRAEGTQRWSEQLKVFQRVTGEN